jgi:AcrR family transcriptional regulator
MATIREARRTQEERSATTRAALIAATIECVVKHGYAATTTTMIADQAGISRGALQHHFSSRDDLVLAVIDEVMIALNFSLDIPALASLPLAERVRRVVAHYHSVFASNQFLAALDIWLGVRSDPALRDRMRAHVAEAQERMATTWRQMFSDMRVSTGDLHSIRRIIMGAARGQAVLEFFGLPRTWREDSKLLEQFMMDLASANQSAPTRGRRR